MLIEKTSQHFRKQVKSGYDSGFYMSEVPVWSIENLACWLEHLMCDGVSGLCFEQLVVRGIGLV